jgi:methylmalonyl-CoA mutase N-terminal domain/subunit
MIAYETGVTNTVDPLGGSYFVESLTDRLEGEAEAYFQRIEAHGGVVPAIEAGFMQKEIADAAFRHQQELEQRRRIVVGVNEFVSEDQQELEILRIPLSLEQEQVERVREVRRKRDEARAVRALEQVRRAAASPDENLMPHILDAVRAYCTEGEIMGAMVDVFGLYTEKALI